ncbi:MAG: PepSY domain-containing protein [Actinobacteria bacterium]|nr:PepSY domain-containing protein [Actinomycetota bacterium]
MRRRLVLVAALATVLAVAVTGFAIAAGGGEEHSLTGTALERASAAAIEHTGGGTVIETETGDDGSAYGVEVRLSSGQVVEVSLDDSFVVLGTETDDDGREGADNEADAD